MPVMRGATLLVGGDDEHGPLGAGDDLERDIVAGEGGAGLRAVAAEDG